MGRISTSKRDKSGIILKSLEEIELMRKAGKVVAFTLNKLAGALRPRMTTAQLDRIAESTIRGCGAKPSFKGYVRDAGHRYPASLCVAINDQVVHGLPGPRILREGDLIGMDLGAIVDGFHGDAAITVAVGRVSPEAERLMEVTQEALARGIEQAGPGNRLSDVSAAIQEYAESQGYSVVRDLVGHGIGREMHEAPQIPNFVTNGYSPKLRVGMTLAIEPMVNAGGPEIECAEDGWTYRTRDGSLSAHFEHTIAIGERGAIILTSQAQEGCGPSG